jgi:hypothetical protein
MTNSFIVEHNSTAINEVLQQFSEQLSDLRDPMQQIAAVVANATEEALKAALTTGAPWQVLSDNYLTAPPKRGGGKMLQLSAGGLISRIKIINTSWNMNKLQPLDTVINAFKVPVQNLNEGAYDILQDGIQKQ